MLQLLSPPLNGTDRAFQPCVTRPRPPFGDEFLNGFLAPTDCVLALVPHAWLALNSCETKATTVFVRC